ncbi:hypothetical protein ACRYWZ_15650 [Agrobacterium deltaense]|uniref:hypothetical protein n=1 Tax=Agrobacterium deltaense TaxID=1183412 RepID=UPI003D969CAC
MIRIVQIACVAVTAVALYGLMKVVDGIMSIVGNTFDAGFVIGMVFTIAVYGLICWIDPSSRPRGSSTDK